LVSQQKIKSIPVAAATFGKLCGIAGGFRGFRSFSASSNLSLICPGHCTMYKQETRDLFNDKALGWGAGLVIEL